MYRWDYEKEPTYAEMMEKLGGRADWTADLSERAAHALMRDGWTLEKLRKAVAEDYNLSQIPNVGHKVASHILEWLDCQPGFLDDDGPSNDLPHRVTLHD